MTTACSEAKFYPMLLCGFPIMFGASCLVDKRRALDIYLVAISAILIKTHAESVEICHPLHSSCCFSTKSLMTTVVGTIGVLMVLEACKKKFILWRFRVEWAAGEREVTTYNPSLLEVQVVNKQKYERDFREFAIRSALLLSLFLFYMDYRKA